MNPHDWYFKICNQCWRVPNVLGNYPPHPDRRQTSLLVAAQNAYTSMRCKPHPQMLTPNEQNYFTHSDSLQHIMSGPCDEYDHIR